MGENLKSDEEMAKFANTIEIEEEKLLEELLAKVKDEQSVENFLELMKKTNVNVKDAFFAAKILFGNRTIPSVNGLWNVLNRAVGNENSDFANVESEKSNKNEDEIFAEKIDAIDTLYKLLGKPPLKIDIPKRVEEIRKKNEEAIKGFFKVKDIRLYSDDFDIDSIFLRRKRGCEQREHLECKKVEMRKQN
jgi:hypothetical protein